MLGAELSHLAASKALAVGDLLVQQINAVEVLSINRVLHDAAIAANAQYGEDAETIRAGLEALDRQWVAAQGSDSLIYDVLNNPMAAELRRFQGRFPDHVEVFITDAQGALLAATNRTTDYYQADEAWWQAAFRGQGATHIAAPMFDESAGTLGYASRSIYGEDHNLLGVLAAATISLHLMRFCLRRPMARRTCK